MSDCADNTHYHHALGILRFENCFFVSIFFPSVLATEPRASHMLGTLSTTEPPLWLFRRYCGTSGVTFTSYRRAGGVYETCVLDILWKGAIYMGLIISLSPLPSGHCKSSQMLQGEELLGLPSELVVLIFQEELQSSVVSVYWGLLKVGRDGPLSL